MTEVVDIDPWSQSGWGYVTPDAALSPDGLYRWWLSRLWPAAWEASAWEGRGPMIIIGLNPSTADAKINDNTIKKCMGFARREQHTGLIMLNLFAWRATEPADMKLAWKAGKDIIGVHNDGTLRTLAAKRRVVCAWGTDGDFLERDVAVHRLLREVGAETVCFDKITKDGHPPHPLYLKGTTPLVPYSPRAA